MMKQNTAFEMRITDRKNETNYRNRSFLIADFQISIALHAILRLLCIICNTLLFYRTIRLNFKIAHNVTTFPRSIWGPEGEQWGMFTISTYKFELHAEKRSSLRFLPPNKESKIYHRANCQLRGEAGDNALISPNSDAVILTRIVNFV